MTKDNKTFRQAVLALVLLTLVMAAGPSFAEGRERNRKGMFLGFNAGWGSAGFSSQVGDQTISDDPYSGGAGALRVGYAFSNSLGLSLEGHGFGTSGDSDDEDWGLGAGFLVVTWWPDGSGFFVRLGGGVGGGDIRTRGRDDLIHIEDEFAGLFGLGYEWQLGDKFALGVAFDGIGFDMDSNSDLVEDFAGLGNMTVQFNWYY